ncbi:MAG: nuclear transport factor 2 family protein [Flammeovirgaceae bacterium]|nr:nuclear transport factor 2 family protein [Flammeovirgaceae bacterium]
MKKIIFFLAIIATTRVFAQDEKQAVRDVIDRLFTSMNAGDSTMLRSVFTMDVTMVRVVRNKTGEPVLRREGSVDEFAKAVGTPHAEAWSEPVWNMDIKVEGDFAQAWCDYAFYLGNKFSHCGVDAFQLHKTKEGWKIFSLADTFKREGCVIPKEVEEKFK